MNPGAGGDATGLVDRLRAVDPARLALDRPAAEAALAQHLAVFDGRPRPVLWAATPAEALRRAGRHLRAYRRAWRAGLRRHVPWPLRPLAWLGETRPNSPHTEYYNLQGAAEAALDAALRAAGPVEEAALRARLEAAQDDALYDAACAAVRSNLWDRVLDAAGEQGSGGLGVAHHAALAVVEENTRLVLDHPAQARHADLWRPCVEAYAAGLCAYWVGPDEVVALPAPRLRLDARGRLHSLEDPALLWPDRDGPGEAYWFRDGVAAPP